jgi:hypothetical protein
MNLNSATPMRIETVRGAWETDFVMETAALYVCFRTCSTFQPSFALKPGRIHMLEMKFNLQMDVHYTVTNVYGGR